MENALPGGKEASYRLLGLQAIAYDGGVILKRGTKRLFLDGDDVADLVDIIVERLAGGRPVELARLQADVGATRREVFDKLIETLKEHRFLVGAEGGSQGGERREDVFYWNYQTSFADIVGELDAVHLTVFGVNSISLALLGNLRGCGFREITFVDHPALRNVDYFDAQRQLRHEISSALSVPPVLFDDWNSNDEKPIGCFVVCCDFGGRPLMRDWNRFCTDNRVLFYPIVLLDHVVHIGPLVKPDDGPCYECLWARENAGISDFALVRAGEAEPDFGHHAVGYLQPMARAAADFAAIDLLKTFSNALSGDRMGRLIEIDLLGPRLTTRALLKVPDCPVCGQPAVAEESETEDVRAVEETAEKQTDGETPPETSDADADKAEKDGAVDTAAAAEQPADADDESTDRPASAAADTTAESEATDEPKSENADVAESDGGDKTDTATAETSAEDDPNEQRSAEKATEGAS